MPAEIILSDRGAKPRRPGGRPPAGKAGEVDRRLIEAATRLFLRQGFDATSCEQVAALAGAGKASIYARYANKEELFTVVVRNHVGQTFTAEVVDPPGRLPLEARLRVAGRSVLSHALEPEVLALLRVVMTTANRLPELARHTVQIGRETGAASIAAAIVGDRHAPPQIMERALPLAAKFVDLVLAPLQMRALMGDDPTDLEALAPTRLEEAIDLFTASGWLKDWR